jgi:glyoxylase-like metal-dependent hydrolase (beta-lactamase superfamily II)
MVTRLRLGDFEVYSFVESRMHLDGGAMFGVIPKKLWTREMRCDDDNLIALDLNLLLAKTRGKNLLIDTGCGDVATDRERKIYGLSGRTDMERHLAAAGVSPADIDVVLFSHLHFDHSGGGLIRTPGGTVTTRFPNARYVVNAREWSDATHPDERTTATYIPEYMRAYADSGQIDTVEGDVEYLPGVRLLHTGGHTAGHQAIVLASGGTSLGYYADIFPTHTHLKPAWVAAVDTHPLETMKAKKRIVRACVDEGILVAFDHDLDIKLARIAPDGNAFRAVPLTAGELEVVGG